MDLTPVQSTNVHAVGYNQLTQTLWLQFKNGTVYQYASVSADVYQSLLSASDIGSYFATIIKPQRHTMPYTKLGVMPLARSGDGLSNGSPSEDSNLAGQPPAADGMVED